MSRLIDADKVQKMIERETALETGIKQSLVTKLVQIPTIDQWHYPSRGEYPRKGRQVLAYAWNVHNVLAKYDTFDGEDRFVTFDAYNGFIEIKKVIRWQYIVPPKEEE